MSRLQSSLHLDEGMGTINSAVLYGALVMSCLFLPKIIIRYIGYKWTIPAAFIGYILWMAANGYEVSIKIYRCFKNVLKIELILICWVISYFSTCVDAKLPNEIKWIIISLTSLILSVILVCQSGPWTLHISNLFIKISCVTMRLRIDYEFLHTWFFLWQLVDINLENNNNGTIWSLQVRSMVDNDPSIHHCWFMCSTIVDGPVFILYSGSRKIRSTE